MGKVRKSTEAVCVFLLIIFYHLGIFASVYFEKEGFNFDLMTKTAQYHHTNSFPGFVISLLIVWFVGRTSILHRQNIFKKFFKLSLAALFVAIFTTSFYFFKITFFEEGAQWPDFEYWPGILVELAKMIAQALIFACSAALLAAASVTWLLRNTSNS